MATLADFKALIERGGAASRSNGWDCAIVFKLDGMYFVGGPDEGKPVECWTWREVEDELGEDWCEAGNWRRYAVAGEVVR